MQLAFDRSTPVVDFRATCTPLTLGAHKWILWPAIAYKVIVPVRRQHGCNLFQRAILEMCRAGVRAPERIGARLALPVDLVSFVLEQLQSMLLLDARSSLTSDGVWLLSHEDELSEAEDSGYIFADGYTGRLWPRLHLGSLPFVEAELDPRPKFQRGSPGRPVDIFPTVLSPNAITLPETPPTPGDILRAARQHNLRLKAFLRESCRAEDPRADGEVTLSVAKRIRLVSPIPEPIFVAACVFLPKDARYRSWLVTDPCGLGVSNLLRDTMSQLGTGHIGRVRELIERLTSTAWHVDEVELAEFFAEANQVAAVGIAGKLGEAAKLLPADAIQRLAAANERLESARSQSSPSTKSVEDFLGHAYAALEAVFYWIMGLYSDQSFLPALVSDASVNSKMLQRVASSLGFLTSNATLPLFSVSHGAVKDAICCGKKSLSGCLAAALLAARGDAANHPLRSLASRYPGAIEFISHFGRLRIAACHNTASVPTVAEALAVRDQLFDLLTALVGTDPDQNLDTTHSGDLSWGADLVLRIRAQAEQAVVRFQELEDFPVLRSRLIDMFHESILLKLLSKSGSVSADKITSHIRDFVVCASITVEALLSEIEKAAPSDPAALRSISENKKQNARVLDAAALSLGFDLEKGGKLPSSLTHVHVSRLRRAALGQGETLSAMVMAQLLTAEGDEAYPLRAVAQHCPSFLLHVGRVVTVRGHGDEIRIALDHALEIEKMVLDDLRAVLAALD